MPGPHKAISPELMRQRRTERQIRQIYREAPIVRRGTARGKPVKRVYAPTSEQEEQIIELVKTLPEEKQLKYVREPIKEEPAPPPKGIGETLVEITIQPVIAGIASWITGTPAKKVQQIQKFQTAVMPPSLKPVEPVKELGGWIASVEAPVYTVGRIAGLETPRPPPTMTSALISSALGQPYEMELMREYGPEYARGTIMGDIVVSILTGKAVTKAWTGAKQIPKLGAVPTKAEQLYIKGLQKLPGPIKGLFLEEQLVYERPTAIARQRYLSMKMGRFGYTRTPSLSVRAESWVSKTRFTSGIVHTPFEKSFAPSVREVSTRTGSLLLTQKQVSRTVTQQVTKQLTFRMITKPATTQITSQILKTTVKTVPKIVSPSFVPMLVAWTGKQFPHYKLKEFPLTKLLPVTRTYPGRQPIQKAEAIKVPVALQKVFEKTMMVPGREKTFPTYIQKVDQKIKVIQRIDQMQVPEIIQKQMQISQQMLMPSMAKPLRTLTTMIKVPPMFPRPKKGKRKRKRELRGRWYPKVHPIPGPEEMIKRVQL